MSDPTDRPRRIHVSELTDAIERKKARIAELQEQIVEIERTLGKKPNVSPFAPEGFPDLPEIAGVEHAAVCAGVRYRTGRLDVMLSRLSAGSVMAGTLTRSATRSAPVLWCEERLAALAGKAPDAPLAILVNAGNSNAFTGRAGVEAVAAATGACAKALGIPAGNVFMASTGVIGEPLPADRITAKLDELRDGLSPGRIEDAAAAIRTTDTFAKGAGRTVKVAGTEVRIAGIAKGSGMIAPDMATMLVFIYTDAAIAQPLLQKTVSELTDRTFNAITVDSDTSTSDTLLVGATGKSGAAPMKSGRDKGYRAFRNGLEEVMRDLAMQVVKDGEGATKFAEITVTGAKSDKAARRIGLAIANSPLVKTALAGEDPNWGRIVMAVGKSGEAADRDRLSITFGDIVVAEGGWVSPGYSEEAGAAYMKRAELQIGVDVGVGKGTATVWTCDLTHRYVSINADYRS